MFKTLITLGIGIYAGMYMAQNYDIPPVSEPKEILDKLKEFADKHRKKD